MEESISRLAGSTEGQMLWPYEFRELIRGIGRIPVERSTTYKTLRSWPGKEAEQLSAVSAQQEEISCVLAEG